MNRSMILITVMALLVLAFFLVPDTQEVAAGIAIFLLGMTQLEDGFRRFSGGMLENILARATSTTPRALGFGMLTTAVMQSSSLVTVVTISFLSAGLIPLIAGVGVIFGSNIGTTASAWLVAGIGLKVNIAAYAMPFIALSAVTMFTGSRLWRGFGNVLAGMGFLFLGLYFMKEGFDTLSGQIDLSRFAMTGISGLLIYALVGIVITVIMQSSSAAMVVVITALSVSQISYENALAAAIGSNIGTTITAMIGAVSANFQGRRLALAHLIFNVLTAAVALLLIVPLAAAVDTLADLAGIGARDYTLKLAIFHTLFNVMGVTLILPLMTRLIAFLKHRIPEPVPDTTEPHFLSDVVDDFPETAETALRNETLHLLANAGHLIASDIGLDLKRLAGTPDMASAIASGSADSKTRRLAYDTRIKPLYGAIIEFSATLNTADMPPGMTERLFDLRDAAGRITRATKGSAQISQNTLYYTSHQTGRAHELYNTLRTQIARVLIELDATARADADTRSSLWLDDERVEIRRNRAEAVEIIEQAIREGALSTRAATSFLNDARATFHLMDNLLEAARVCYAETDPSLAEVERLLTIEEDEAEEIGQAQHHAAKDADHGHP